MKNPESYKLYDTYRTLSKKEVRQLKKLVRSPFFVIRTNVGRLFEYLEKFYLKDKPFPSKEVIFKNVYPEREYNYGLLRGTMSDLFELIEEYLLIKKRRDGKLLTRHLLAEIYRERKLSKAYHSVVKKTTSILEDQPLRNEFYYQQLLDFQIEEMNFQDHNKRTTDFKFGEMSETMDVLYLVQKLKHTCRQFTHNLVYKKDYDYGLLPLLLKEVEQERYLKIPAIAVYYFCYKFLSNPDDEIYFEKFKAVFFPNKTQFDIQELRGLYKMAINFCIRKLNKGGKKIGVEISALYKDGLEAGYFFENGILSRFTFNNIVAAGIVTEDFKWIEKFIETYSEKLAIGYRDSTVSFNLARLEFTRKNYGAAMLHLQKTEQKDIVDNLIAKSILMKIYYELEEYDSLFSHLDNFLIYIRRREVSDFHRKNFKNNIRFIKKLVALPPGKKLKQELIQEIKMQEVLSEKPWLLEKLA